MFFPIKTTITFILACTLAMLSAQLSAQAQQSQPPSKVYRIGFLTAVSPIKVFALRLAELRKGLRALGYIEGKNIVIEERYAKGRREKLPELAAELVRLKSDVIVTHGDSVAVIADRAAPEAGKEIPIVLAVSSDPVGGGVVSSLARPGGNVTGLMNLSNGLVAKRLQLVNEIVPTASRVAVLWDSRIRHTGVQLKMLQSLAPTMGLTIYPVNFANFDIDGALDIIRRERPDVLNVLGWALILRYEKLITNFALKSRLPTIFTNKRFVVAGGLMSYGVSRLEMYRRTATYVDKILKGAKPAELPVERASRFNLTINLRTAKALSITIPRALLLRADEVIE